MLNFSKVQGFSLKQASRLPTPTNLPSSRSHVANCKSTSKTDLAVLHEQLQAEVEERRRNQERLVEKLTRLRLDLLPEAERPEVYVEPEPPVPVPPTATVDPPQPEVKEPLAGPNVMKIVMVGAECAPWSKTGGLGDVMGALPKALAERGHRVMVVSPRYANYDDAWETGVRRQFSVCNSTQEVGYFHCFHEGVDYVFVDHSSFHGHSKDLYGGGREALMFRCALLSKAALEAVWHVPCGGVAYGDDNLCFIANDWHTALLPVFLQAHYREYNQMTFARCVFVLHNIAHQGRGPFDEVHKLELNDAHKERFRLDDPVGGEHMNILMAGMKAAHRLIAVSAGYAWECKTQDGGWGLHQVLNEHNWKLSGIVNGIDYQEWNPVADKHLTTDGYMNYDISTLQQGKAQCKAALQRELGLPVDPTRPLFGFIGRLDYQKGIDLIRDNFDWIMDQGAQLVMLGSGREDLETALRDMERRRSNQCRSYVGFSVEMAHRITAGVDILLMPSRFEPCGLNQLYAMAYGTPPLVHAVGGLRDTVKAHNAADGSGTGWTFDRAEAHMLRDTIGRALNDFNNNKPLYNKLQVNGMSQDLSWGHAAELYEQVLVAAKYQW